MKTLTLKLPEKLATQLNAYAHEQETNKSAIIREALQEYLTRKWQIQPHSFLALAEDLAGSVEGPPDLSSNPDHMKGYGK